MQFLPLLGLPLKSETLIDLFELWDLEVVYSYDRLYENQPDQYDACWSEGGASFVFDESQILKTIFLFVQGDDDHSPCDLSDSDIPRFDRIDQATSFGRQSGAQVSRGQVDILGKLRDWVRLDWPNHSVHFQYQQDQLTVVTVLRRESRV